MKSVLVAALLVVAVSCGENKKSAANTSELSSNLSQPSTVDGFFFQNGQIEIQGGMYQMASGLSGSQINQQLVTSNVQPIAANGTNKYKARFVGAIYNPCQQGENYNQTLCQSTSGVKFFYVDSIQFLKP